MALSRALVVSLHDVSPRTFAECRRIIEMLRDLGVTRTSLLVIPDHHGHGAIASDAPLCAWLRERAESGHEIVLHGYRHQRTRQAGETARAQFVTRVYTADEGEFYDLSQETAAGLLERGLTEFRALGFHPAGFIAPAWLLSREAQEAVRAAGFAYTTRLRTVTDLESQQIAAAQSLVWSVRSRWRRVVSLAWNAALFRRLENQPLLRLSIHPCDHSHTAIWRQITALTTRALADREPMTYHAWITRLRTPSSATLHPQAA